MVYSEVSDSYRQPTKSVMQILKETNDEAVLKKEITLFDDFSFPKNMRLTSNLLEMHPQILKDKLRISKFIHKYFNPTLYEKNSLRAVRAVMRLDRQHNSSGREGSVNLYEPFNKVPTGLQALKEKHSRYKRRPERRVNKTEPLSKIILERFEETLENQPSIIDNYEQLQRKNRLVDVMDDYYSRHICKEGAKPDHLFMFKAKPIIPPGRVLLQLERQKEKDKSRKKGGHKLKVGDSEISLFSPIKDDRDLQDFNAYNSQVHKSDEQSIRLDSTLRRESVLQQLNSSVHQASNNDLSRVLASQVKGPQAQSPSNQPLSRAVSLDRAAGGKSPIQAQFTFKQESPTISKERASKTVTKPKPAKSKSPAGLLCLEREPYLTPLVAKPKLPLLNLKSKREAAK